MIRYSQKTDISDIIKLWHEAFGDSESEISFFLKHYDNTDNILVYEADGKIVSMLFLLDGEMCIKGNLYPSYYLYAACTLNKHRGKGYMSYLLNFAKETAKKRGYYFICLLPGEKTLYDYYEKYGYKPIFKSKLLNLSVNDLNNSVYLSYNDNVDVEKIRNDFLNNIDYFKWSKSSLDFAFEHNKLYGGQAIVTCNGYTLYSVSNSVASVKEIAFTDDTCYNFLNFIDTKNISEIVINLPCDYSATIGEFEIINHGMMLAVNDDAEKIMQKVDCAYLGLTLD